MEFLNIVGTIKNQKSNSSKRKNRRKALEKPNINQYKINKPI